MSESLTSQGASALAAPQGPRLHAAQVVWLGWACMLVPTLVRLFHEVWANEDQSHGPVLIAAALWLIWQKRDELFFTPVSQLRISALPFALLSLATYVVGRSQAVLQLEAGGIWLAAASCLFMTHGWRGLRLAAIPLIVALFVIPLPGIVVQTLTIPLKTGASIVAQHFLYALNYPIAREGVSLAIGQYQLLVADACAGLTSMFTLEAMGLVYVNQLGNTEPKHQMILTALILPISFIANVARVIILVLITYYLGDAVGQGFIHEFAGVVLFTVATVLMYLTDKAISAVLSKSTRGAVT